MTESELRAMFPNAAQSLFDANCERHPLINEQNTTHQASPEARLPLPGAPICPPKGKKGVNGPRKPREPNKTEAEYGRILATIYPNCQVIYEGISLKWGDCMWYCPDWVVIREPSTWDQNGQTSKWLLVEVKGAHIWDRDTVRFKGCRAEWSKRFDFEMHQKKSGEWRRLH